MIPLTDEELALVRQRTDEELERAAGVRGLSMLNTGNCPEVSMPTHRDQDTAC